MSVNIILIILFSIAWNCREGYLVLRDKTNSKGTTSIDKLTRFFNFLATEISLLSPLLMILFPLLDFNTYEILSLTILGTFFAFCGLILRYWAISVLGKFFRTTVEIDSDQTIIQKGPYKVIRHPSYSGIILFFIGYGLLSQNWMSMVICFLLPTVVLIYRISVEEKAFVDILGAKYGVYQSKTKKLIPFIY